MLGAQGQVFAKSHADRVGKKVGKAENQHRKPADLGDAFALRAGKTGHDGKGGDDPVISTIDDLLEEFLGAAEGMRLSPVCLPVHLSAPPLFRAGCSIRHARRPATLATAVLRGRFVPQGWNFVMARPMILGTTTSICGDTFVRDLKIPGQRHPEKAHRPDNAQPKKPDWIRVKAPTGKGYRETHRIMREHKLVTVCEEAGCPNAGECWNQGHATMMIMGETCTRGCTFCNVATGKPDALDVFEPGRVADAVQKLGLNHVVITSVDRDDVEDGGAEHFAQTIRAVRHRSPGTTIEILTPDFLHCAPSVLETVVAAKPDVFNHNLETVPALYPSVRPGARYFHSLRLL